jgi:hypothetical protein
MDAAGINPGLGTTEACVGAVSKLQASIAEGLGLPARTVHKA